MKQESLNGLTPWAKVSVVGFMMLLVLYLLGALPGVKSPIDKIVEAVQRNSSLLEAHIESTEHSLRLICKGVWRGNQEIQETCR